MDKKETRYVQSKLYINSSSFNSSHNFEILFLKGSPFLMVQKTHDPQSMDYPDKLSKINGLPRCTSTSG